MKRFGLLTGIACLVMVLCPGVSAQMKLAGTWPTLASDGARDLASSTVADIALASPAVLPRMSPELALDAYQHRVQEQSNRLAGYSDDTIMTADLPDTNQRGEYELSREYSAPNNLQFKVKRFIGDGFVKTNILARLLQSEADHVTKQQGPQTAIDSKNYKFGNKTVEYVNGQLAYAYHVKPRKKRVGLFKGKIYLDPYTGALIRAEGQMVKSPSLFIKRIDFVQDYNEINGFMLPVRLHSVAKVRLIGRTVVDVLHRSYQLRTLGMANAGSSDANTAAMTN